MTPGVAVPGTTRAEEFDFAATLTDGSVVHVRPPRPVDREALVALHVRVSKRSHYLRYFSLPSYGGEQYVDTLLAPHTEDLPGLAVFLGEVLVAMASYERLATRDEAEVAFLVDDAHHWQGIATLPSGAGFPRTSLGSAFCMR